MVDGMDVREYKITDLRDKIGIVPQKAVLFAGTVRSNLAWGKEGCDGRRDAAGAFRCTGSRSCG